MIPYPSSPTRPCKTCREMKPESGFYPKGEQRNTECKDCWKARVKLRRLIDPKVRAYDRQRAKTPARVDYQTRNTKAWRERNPDAYRAQNALNNALRDGKIDRKPCEICAQTSGIHAHHKDYAKPLDVIWLCARCHHRLHALFPEFAGANKRQERA